MYKSEEEQKGWVLGSEMIPGNFYKCLWSEFGWGQGVKAGEPGSVAYMDSDVVFLFLGPTRAPWPGGKWTSGAQVLYKDQILCFDAVGKYMLIK